MQCSCCVHSVDVEGVGLWPGRPWGGASCLGVGRPRLGTLSHPTAHPWGVRPGPATHWLWMLGVWAWGPVTNPTERALASWLCVLWGRHKGAGGGGRLLPGCGASGVRRSPTPNRPSLGGAAGARYPLALDAGGLGLGTCLQPHSARSCELALRAVGAGRGRPGGGGGLLPGSGASGLGRSPTHDQPSLGRAAGAP